MNPLSDAKKPETQVLDQKVWNTPELETLDLASTESGPAPKNNENVNFYVG